MRASGVTGLKRGDVIFIVAGVCPDARSPEPTWTSGLCGRASGNLGLDILNDAVAGVFLTSGCGSEATVGLSARSLGSRGEVVRKPTPLLGRCRTSSAMPGANPLSVVGFGVTNRGLLLVMMLPPGIRSLVQSGGGSMKVDTRQLGGGELSFLSMWKTKHAGGSPFAIDETQGGER